MQVTPHVYQMHIDDGAAFHPGGSNNYFVGDPAEEMVLIDAGDLQRAWTDAILEYHRELGSPRVTSILITHGHSDHIGGLDRLQEALDCTVRCHPKLADRLTTMLGEGIVSPLRSRSRITTGGGIGVRPIFTPGHEVDHVCYYLPRDRVMFTGDTVLGASSTTVSELSRYMHSLGVLSTYRHKIICPGHGPVVFPPEGSRLVQEYIDHRRQRERQVVAALGEGLETVSEITRSVYPQNLKRDLRAGAERNVEAHLRKLIDEEAVQAMMDAGARYRLA